MKKKKFILFIILGLFGFLELNNVQALEACTDAQIKDAMTNARATLSVSVFSENVSIPSLGRTASNGKANIYKMSMSAGFSGRANSAFCLDSDKSARSGTVYKIDHEVTSQKWKKAYQYGMEYKNDDIKYIVAQASLWLLRDQKSWENNLAPVAEDIYVNKNCKTILRSYGMNESQASSVCATAAERNDSTNFIYSQVFNLCSKKDSCNTKFITLSITNTVKDFMSYSKTYSGRLFYWIPTSGNYQSMVAPLSCSDYNNPTGHSCTDSNGIVHDYTSEYNRCLSSGGNSLACESELKDKYCPGTTIEKKYVVKNTGTGAVCTNDETNNGTYYEYVEESETGNAIPGKGDPQDEAQISPYCNLYCLENTAQQIFPGNLKSSVSIGGYVIWPTSASTVSSIYKNYYPLKFYGEKTCYVVMAGTDNPINTTNIQTLYNKLISDIKNNYDGTFAKRNYESSRLNGGCESIYNNTNGACSSSYNDMNEKEKSYNDYNNSDTYKNAVTSKKAKEEHNSGVASCEAKANEAANACSSSYNSCKGKGCKTAYDACMKNVDDNCGSKQSTADEDKIIKERDDRLDSYNKAKQTYESCQSQKNACNSYTTAVNKIIEFANNIKSCINYTPSCSGSSCDIYNYTTHVDLSWTDEEYGKIIDDSQLEKTKNYTMSIENNNTTDIQVNASQGYNTIKNNTTTLVSQANSVPDQRKIIAKVDVTYSLPTTGTLLYNYVVTDSNNNIKSQSEAPSSYAKFSEIGFSNLPVSFNAKTGINYNLKLSNISFGDNGQYSPDEYVCNYQVTKVPPSDCVCPEDSDFPGKDLSTIMANEGKTCTDAQKTCYKGGPGGPDGDTCTNSSGQTVDISGCMAEGKDYFTCYDEYCPPITDSKYCKDKDGNLINITACTKEYSREYCEKLICGDEVIHEYCTNKAGNQIDITACVENDSYSNCAKLYCPEGIPQPTYCTTKEGNKVDITTCVENNSYEYCKNLICPGTPTPTYCEDAAGNKIDMTTCLKNNSYDACVQSLCPSTTIIQPTYCTTKEGNKVDITACVENNSYSECAQFYCPGGDGKYKCTNTNNVDGPMDITSCVVTKMTQGMGENEAIAACDKLVCPLTGLRIIYRTISLENPFPSKLADAQVTQTGLSVGMFNDDIKGRYPGANWNNQALVKNHILNVTRNGSTIDGSNIYQSEPLYTFVLTPDRINAIRNYNKSRIDNGGYADYTLECRLNNSLACISNFVHSDLSGLTSGLCQHATSRNNFYTCSGD